jgi:hypothetical protein
VEGGGVDFDLVDVKGATSFNFFFGQSDLGMAPGSKAEGGGKAEQGADASAPIFCGQSKEQECANEQKIPSKIETCAQKCSEGKKEGGVLAPKMGKGLPHLDLLEENACT